MTRNKTLRLLGAYPGGYVRSASGAAASFNADQIAPLREFTVSINPVQSGSGDPAPDNVRPISGWTGANVYQSAALPALSAWDVLGYDEDVFVVNSNDHVMSVQRKAVLIRLPFDPIQYLFAVTAAACTAFGWPSSGADAGMPAGTYNITLYKAAYDGGTTQDGTYQFTTTQRIPIGGGIRHTTIGAYQSSSYTHTQIINGTFITYGADTTTVIESGLLTTEGNGGTNLGTTTACDPRYKSGDYVNFSQRQANGSNRWKTSYIRQYLNSFDAELNFVPATIWSRNRTTKPEGFLHAIEPALRAVIGKVRKRYALSIADGYGYEDVEDYCTLSTMLDLGLGANNSINEGPVTSAGVVKRTTAYSFWKGTVQADRIKYQGSTASYWWLGSAYRSTSGNERYMNTSGALSNFSVANTEGVVPSLFIRLSSLINVSWQSEAGTVYGGTLDVTKGVLTVTSGNIDSYNGETLPGAWISSMDVYTPGGTPTTGAQVVYELNDPITYQLTPVEVQTLLGRNNIWSDTGDVALTWREGGVGSRSWMLAMLTGRRDA